jgi:hypothetical protein
MKRPLFKILARLNKALLPSFGRKDLSRLTGLEKALIAYRYWVTRNALD